MSSTTRLFTVLAASLAVLPGAGAFAQVNVAHNPYPNRPQKLVTGFENATVCTEAQVVAEECPAGWHGFQAGPPTKPVVTINTDPKFVAEGTKSLKVDMTSVEQNWHSEFFRGVFAEPVDAGGFNTLSMNVYYTFDSETGENANTSWSEMFIRIQKVNADGSDAGEDWYGNRNFRRGWNFFTWDLNPPDHRRRERRRRLGRSALLRQHPAHPAVVPRPQAGRDAGLGLGHPDRGGSGSGPRGERPDDVLLPAERPADLQ
jgi:hypothetical protein